MMIAMPNTREIESSLLALARARGKGKTFCPSEAAQALTSDWRSAMPDVRAVAGRLAKAGKLAATQSGKPVDPVAARGPIRLGLPQR